MDHMAMGGTAHIIRINVAQAEPVKCPGQHFVIRQTALVALRALFDPTAPPLEMLPPVQEDNSTATSATHANGEDSDTDSDAD